MEFDIDLSPNHFIKINMNFLDQEIYKSFSLNIKCHDYEESTLKNYEGKLGSFIDIKEVE